MKTKNKFFTLLAMFFMVNVFYAPAIKAQMTKFQKWEQPSYFVGFNMSVWDNYHGREVNQQDFDSLAAIGANLVVIQTQGSRTVYPPYGPSIYWADFPDTIFHVEMLDAMVDYARNAGLMYVIAVRDGPGRMDVSMDTGSTIWTNFSEQKLYGKMLKEIAQRYLPDNLFVGFTLTVEPNPLGELWEPPISVLDSALLADGIDLGDIYALWIDSVRTVDNDLPLIVGGHHACHPEYFSLLGKQADNKIVYTTHLYNPANLSHSYTPYSETYPGSYWSVRLDDVKYFNKVFLKDSLYKPVRDFQQTYNVPILIGEFGIGLPQNGGDLYFSDIGEIACELGWHYAIWGFNNGPEFNYKDLDSIYGTNYWDVAKNLINCNLWGMKENNDEAIQLSIFPNPSDGIFTISTNGWNLEMIEIYNVLGEMIYSYPCTKHTSAITINLSAYPKGIYFANFLMNNGKKNYTGKIVIQ